MLPRHHHLRWLLLPLAAACALVPGCAGLRAPRIDPTGERFLIWPKDEVVTPVTAIPGATLPPITGNVLAPPVGTDPFFPSVPTTAIGAPAVAAAPTVMPASVAYPQSPQDKLAITPGRVLAPVGSEVVLKANICTPQGYTLANQKVEWMLGRNGVGQFVELGGKGVFHPPLIPWNRGEKVDNYLANGYTADGPLCIDRGTADPTDDININRGDAWISVTSPNEGTSHVTAYTPAVESWDLRKASATIYWVDVQWTFPPPSLTCSGRGETLTTVVNRQTDGTPLEGWIVRYEVADGTGKVTDVRTGADGRASVQVAPTAAGGATSQINVQLLRPANFASSDAPQLVVGTGTTVINWGGSQPYLPPTTSQPLQPPPAAPIQQNPITPPPSLPATSARLELTVTGPPQAQVGGPVRFQAAIRNVGDAPAMGVVLVDEFDKGLIFPNDPSRNKIRNDRVGTIAPGETRTVDIDFQVSKAGELCQTVSVEYAQGNPVSKRVCVNAVGSAPQRQGGLKVSISEPTTAILGQPVRLTFTVENTGEMALTNIRTEVEFPTGILQPQVDPNAEIISGKILRRIERLEVGTKRQFEVVFDSLYATQATVLIRGRAETDPPTFSIENTDDHSFEIQQAGGQPSAGPAPGPAAPGAASPLSVVVSFVNPTVRVGTRATVEVTVTNKGAVPDQAVALRVYFPTNVTPDAQNVEGPRGLPAPQLVGDRLDFQPLASLAPGEIARYVIPISPTQPGIVPITAQAISRNVTREVTHAADLEIIGNRL